MTLMTSSLAPVAHLDDSAVELDTPATSGTDTPTIPASRPAREADTAAKALLALMAELPADGPARPGVRRPLTRPYVRLAEPLARRFRNRGEPYDDLVQVACLAL